MTGSLSSIRICDFSGILAGAWATKWMAAFGAEVIRIEDPVKQGRWDILRGAPPYIDGRSGINLGGGFNNHNTEKYGITLNLRTPRAKELLEGLISQSDVLTENFAAGVLERWGFGYERLKAIKPDIIYISNCGFGHVGPYSQYRTWGPIVQAISGLTYMSALPGQEPAGWGYSYMDHTGAYYMAMALLMALIHRQKTGEGQWVDLACTESALTLHGPQLLDWSLNKRPSPPLGQVNSNRSIWPPMAPHGIFECAGDDEWISISCRNQSDWDAFRILVGEDWCDTPDYEDLAARLTHQDELDHQVSAWTRLADKHALAAQLLGAGIPAAAVMKPQERIDDDPHTREFGLWPEVQHTEMGSVRVDGLPVHFSGADWTIRRGGPCLGEHNELILGKLLGLSEDDVAQLAEEGVI